MYDLIKISVITPSFNQEKYIERTIKSVLGQDYPAIEYIIIDGGSTDGTLEILKKYDRQIKWISEKDKGQSDALNKGIKMSTGEIIGYLNADDTYEIGALRRIADVFVSNPSIMWLTGRCRIVDENDKEIRRMITRYKNFLLDHYSFHVLLVTNPISQPATFWRRKIIEECGYFDVNEHLAMDYEFWLRIGKKYLPMILDDYLARFRVYRTSKTSRARFQTLKQELRISRKYSQAIPLDAFHCMHAILIGTVYALIDIFSLDKTR